MLQWEAYRGGVEGDLLRAFAILPPPLWSVILNSPAQRVELRLK